ncbi:unnamed protein product [Notodromas monacha]|uniref:Uncharacterized protein n=1 Tax=Notodromas monacha TaxID=399045 RepID=A0A7R9BE79_9CRUS|nr:unnamed protein product [Notodromas monacha]CAG0913710.1 unnamed protein product [Notodromas monacha]
MVFELQTVKEDLSLLQNFDPSVVEEFCKIAAQSGQHSTNERVLSGAGSRLGVDPKIVGKAIDALLFLAEETTKSRSDDVGIENYVRALGIDDEENIRRIVSFCLSQTTSFRRVLEKQKACVDVLPKFLGFQWRLQVPVASRLNHAAVGNPVILLRLVTTAGDLEEFKAGITERAEDFIKHGFAKRIIYLNELIGSPDFNIDVSDVISDLNIPVPSDSPLDEESNCEEAEVSDDLSCCKIYILPNGPAPCNTKLVDLNEKLKPILIQLLDETNLDGNNFGVSIQIDAIEVIREIETQISQIYTKISNYHVKRAAATAKVMKHPQLEDLRRVVEEVDEKHYRHLRRSLIVSRDSYAELHDTIAKNLEKIRAPLNSRLHDMY